MAIKSVLKVEESEHVIFDFKPRSFQTIVSASASAFVLGQKMSSSDFQINPIAAEQAGVAKLQRDALNDRIEEEALQQLKDVEEKAYHEAYELGLKEGRELAFNEQKANLEEKLLHFDSLINEIENMKSKIVADHEVHIISMVNQIASRIAMREIKADPASILPVVLQVIADSQSDEHLTIRISPEDLKFLELAREKVGRAGESLKRVKLEPVEGMTAGGCLLDSNFGSIDATVEARVQKAWTILSERLPKSEQRTTGGGTDGA